MTDSPGYRLWQWEQGATPGPWFISVFPTNRCNLRCSICWQRRVEIDYSHELSDERWLALVDEAADLGVREWVIVGGGEPMVRDDLVIRMCERIMERGMKGRIQTNGYQFKEDHFARLLDIGWDSIVFSVDGPTEEINDAVRSKGSFTHATDHIRTFARMRKERGADVPRLYMSMVTTRLSAPHLDRYVELAHELGCDRVNGSHLTIEGDYCQSLALTEQEMAELPEYVQRAEQRARELGFKQGFGDLLLQPKELVGKACPPLPPPETKGLLRTPCFEPWLSVQVLADGKVGPCCVFWDTEADNIQTASLRDIWLGPYFQHLRAGMIAQRFPPYCVYCHTSFRVRDALFRGDLARTQEKSLMAKATPLQRGVYILRKSVASVKKNGWSGALRHGKEWWRLHSKPQ